MKNRTKLLLSVGVVGAIGVVLAVGTSAFFNSSATSGTNVAATGTLTIDDGTPGADVYFDSSDGLMKPIDGSAPDGGLGVARAQNVLVNGSATVTNTGTLTAAYSLSQTQVGGTLLAPGDGVVNPGARPALFKKARLCITRTAPVVGSDCNIYNGAFDVGAAAPDGTGDITTVDAIGALGTLAPGATATYQFEVWLPNDADTDNDYQDKKATAVFRFDAS